MRMVWFGNNWLWLGGVSNTWLIALRDDDLTTHTNTHTHNDKHYSKYTHTYCVAVIEGGFPSTCVCVCTFCDDYDYTRVRFKGGVTLVIARVLLLCIVNIYRSVAVPLYAFQTEIVVCIHLRQFIIIMV